MRTFIRLLLPLAVIGAVLAGCGLSGQFKPNQAPETTLYVQGEVDTVAHIAHLHWFGSDTDGDVVGYEIRLLNPVSPAETAWVYTLRADSIINIQAPQGFTAPVFQVRAVDNEGFRDPTPASEDFQFRNIAPTVQRTDKPAFTDTTFAVVTGIAAGEDGYVYVSGQAIVLDTLESDPHIRTRTFASRVYRYARGPRYAGITPGDVNMPGCNWHRDTTWVVLDGSGTSSVFDPAGIYYARSGGHTLYITDRGNSKVKGVSVHATNLGLVQADGSTTGSNFLHPEDVTADLAGYFYVVDRGNRRVLRYDGNTGEYKQRVDVEPNSQSEELLDPVAVAVDDSLAYVADRGRGKVIRFKRRP